MAQEKDHICAGVNCIFCKIAAEDQVGDYASGLAIVNEQALSRVKALESTHILNQFEPSKEQGSQIEQLEKMTFYDQLTGLSNIHVFLRELTDEVARARRYQRPLSLGALRIDNYEEIKAKYGPLGCELVLKHVGRLLQKSLREADIAARLHADQFAIILPETNEGGANVAAERIRQSLVKKPAKLNTVVLDITVSIGVATFPKHGQEVETLLDSCLNAQEEALSNGGNRVHGL
jgi:diguanylate cyclase (GGDEF)-like protein